MHYIFSVLLLLLTCASNCYSQELQRRFALPASFTSTELIEDSTYLTTLQFQADQSGNGYLPTQVARGWRILTSTQGLYRIDSVRSANFAEATVRITRLGTGPHPSGVGLVYEYSAGSPPTIPSIAVNATGIPANLAAAVATHNSLLSVGIQSPLDYGRIRFVNKEEGNNATAQIGNPSLPYKDYVAAAYAPDQRKGDVIYTYDSHYKWSELSTQPGNSKREITNPRNGLIFVFRRVTIEGTPNARERVFQVDFKPTGPVPQIDSGQAYGFTVRGDVNLKDMMMVSVWSDSAGVFSNGQPLPKIKIDYEAGEINGVNSDSHNEFAHSISGSNVEVNADIGVLKNMVGSAFSVNLYDMGNGTYKNKSSTVRIKTLYNNPDRLEPALFYVGRGQKTDSSNVNITIDQVVNTSAREINANKGHLAQLVVYELGATYINSSLSIHIKEIRLISRRNAPYSGQGARDYSDVTNSPRTKSEEARLFRLNGNLSGSRIFIDCQICVVEDGAVIVEEITGNPQIFISGHYFSEQQSVVKFGAGIAGDNSTTHLNGYYYSKNAPAVSASLTAPSPVAKVILQGKYATGSSSFPAIAINRATVFPSGYIERLTSSGGRPAIESNVQNTSLLYGSVFYNGPGDIIGPNFSRAPLKTIQTP